MKRLGPGHPGKLIRQIREYHGFTQRELAQMAGYHFNTVRRAELNHFVNWQTVFDLLNTLGYELHIQAKSCRWEEPYGAECQPKNREN